MKNKHLALFMALIMCFSLVFGAAAATTEGEQIMPSTSVVTPTDKEDIADKIGGALDDAAGDKMSEVGSEIMDGIYEGNAFLSTVYRVLENIKIFFANLINTIFPMFDIGTGGSLFG